MVRDLPYCAIMAINGGRLQGAPLQGWRMRNCPAESGGAHWEDEAASVRPLRMGKYLRVKGNHILQGLGAPGGMHFPQVERRSISQCARRPLPCFPKKKGPGPMVRGQIKAFFDVQVCANYQTSALRKLSLLSGFV